MPDFLLSNVTKSAVRQLADPIACHSSDFKKTRNVIAKDKTKYFFCEHIFFPPP